MNKYSQPSLSAALFCNFSLNWIAVINTQNSLCASNPSYCDSAFNKISYPVVPSPADSQPPSSATEEKWLSLSSPSSPTSSHLIQTNQPTRSNSFTSLLFDVYVWLNMFRALLRPSSGAYNRTRSLWFCRWERGGWSVVGCDLADRGWQHSNRHAPNGKTRGS